MSKERRNIEKLYDVIKRPIITEKSMMATALGKYTFEVQKDATKVEIAQAVELAFPGRKVKKVNGYVMGTSGEYRNHDIYVGNLVEAVYYPPASDKVEELMKAFEKTVNIKEKNIDKLLLEIAQQHIVFERIHPFQDGNGRTGRILINQQLINNGLPPISIKPTGKYRQAFRRYNNSGDLSQMVYILAKSELESFDRILQQESRYLLNRDGRNVEVKSKLRATEREIDL